MLIDFSGYQRYNPYPCKPGYVPDPSQLLDITGRGPNSTGEPPKWSDSISRPSVDTYEPSGSFTLPDNVSFYGPNGQKTNAIKPAWTNMQSNGKIEYNGTITRPDQKECAKAFTIRENDPTVIGRIPLHNFLTRNGAYLAEAAQEIAATGKNTSYTYNVENEVFARDTLDFFTNGQYSSQDVETLTKQLDQVVLELAEQIKSGQQMDMNKVKTKLTVAGAETTAADLFKFQKMGRILEDSMHMHGGDLIICDYAKTGVTIAAAKKMAATHGELGKMFSQTVDRFYGQHRNKLHDFSESFIASAKNRNPALFRDSSKTGLEILDMYANINFGNSSSIAQAHHTAANMVQQHCQQFGVPNTHYVSAGDTAIIDRYAEWLNAQLFE